MSATSPDDSPSPQRILLRGPNPVGDLVMATASFAAIRRAFPQARITLLLKPGRDAIVEGADFFDELLVDDSHRGPRAFFRLVGTLRQRRFELAILFTNVLRSAAVIALGGARRRVGYPKGGQGVFLTERVQPPRRPDGKWSPRPMTEIYGDLCAAVGVDRGDGWPCLAIPDALESAYRERRGELGIAADERLIGIVPGAAFGASKLWPPERIAAAADALTDRYGLRTMIFAGPGEEPIVAAVKSAMRTTPIDALERPLGLALTKPFVRDLALLLTMDTGPRHIATAFRVPTLCVMGPTDPLWTASCLDRQEVVRHDVPCGPCQLPVCPIDHVCMKGIAVDEVLERIEVLDRRLGVFAPGA